MASHILRVRGIAKDESVNKNFHWVKKEVIPCEEILITVNVLAWTEQYLYNSNARICTQT